MKNKPLDFQAATAEHVLETYKKGQKRVLVADEAGLGKTTVASEVVRRVKGELSKEVLDDDGMYCVVYVCCNLQIAQQNIDTLSDDGEKVDLSQSRLSMQHFVYYRKKVELKASGKDTLVLSLTPATSFQMTWGTGSVSERALIYACLSLLPAFNSQEKQNRLSDLLVGWAPKAWKWLSVHYYNEVRKPELIEYRETIVAAMTSKLSRMYSADETYMQRLLRLCDSRQDAQWQNDIYYFTIKLRKIFAEISLEILKPDLVIMDEFQKFSSLIDTDRSTETEENMIARKFFANKNTYILLLSATPYKPYTTLEELNDSNNDEQYKDFHRLMDFLHINDVNKIDFKAIWRDYSSALKHIEKETEETIGLKHQSAENMLYNVMGRTERSNEGIIHEILPPVYDFLSAGDITSFIQMQHLIDNCRKFGKKVYSAPVDYTKSSAFQLSFMDNYKLKDTIAEAWKAGAGKGIRKDCLLLDRDKIENYSLEDYRNARLGFIMATIFGKGKKSTGAESLLWIPASHPYYTQQPNVFTRNESFSKYLIFSSWGMVPKMLACMISYEAERRLLRRTNESYRKEDFQILKDSTKTKTLTIMHTVSTSLADMYDPEDSFGKPLSDIRQQIKKKIRSKLNEFDGKTVSRVSSLDIYHLLTALDNSDAEVRNIPKEADEILVSMAIGAPAMCLYRTFKRIGDLNARQHAEEVAKELTGIFNNRQGIAAVRSNCRDHSNYFRNVVDYCIQGNLQAVLDEFVHMIGENKSPETIVTRMKESFAPAYPQPINTIQTFGTDDKYSMRKHFAVDFGSGKQTEKDVNHATNVRSAFNSPFRPFVLASTSVGQEGLDFHWYCRKIVHWNLPSNPQNMEQREGRINRYKCLSVRRNISRLYPDIFRWNEMFYKASAELKGNNSEMVPFWYLPLNDIHFKDIKAEKIERIVPMYPMSEDESRYGRLIKVLSLYRLTMGQPRQEELLQILDGKISPEQIKRLLFDLCPFSRKHH
ncbi:helicase-related protein [Duncaniella muris]|uniref:helicase-related protein n=2 Tax=Duncaniella TaxID=2518495 RepID=UPI0025B74BCC|nr:helicase-related protein [Duncaniella muris]